MSDLCSLRELYVLGGLSDEEGRDFEKHLKTCDECQRELKAFQDVTDALLFDFDEVRPPSGMRERVLSHILDEHQKTSTETPQGSTMKSVGGAAKTNVHLRDKRVKAKISTRSWWAFGAAAIVFAVLVAGGTYSYMSTSQKSVSPLGTVSKTISLQSKLPGATAKMWVTTGQSNHQLLIHFNHLKAVEGTQVYQVWLIQKGSSVPYSAGVFTPTSKGNAVFASIMPSGSYQTVAVTLEPKAIDKKPLGPIVFQAST